MGKLTEDEINAIINEIGFELTTSEELNSKEYQPFITADDGTIHGAIWTFNKEHLLDFLRKL